MKRFKLLIFAAYDTFTGMSGYTPRQAKCRILDGWQNICTVTQKLDFGHDANDNENVGRVLQKVTSGSPSTLIAEWVQQGN